MFEKQKDEIGYQLSEKLDAEHKRSFLVLVAVFGIAVNLFSFQPPLGL